MDTVRVRKLALVMIVALIVSGIVACDIGREPAKPTVTITAPTSDAQVELGDVNVLVSASDPKGIVRVELSVDGALYRTDANPDPEGQPSWALVQMWTATDPGMHTLSVTAYNVDGAASDPWAVTVEVLEEGEVVATPTPPTGPPPAATDTPPPPPAATDTPPPPAEPTDTPPPGPTDTPEPEPTDTPVLLPDLVLSALLVTPSDPAWGGSVQVRFDVGNLGNAPSGPYKIVWRYGPGDFDVIEDNKPSLPPGSGGTVNWTLPEIYASYNTVAAVDPFNEVEESNEGNNSEQFMVNVGPLEADLYPTEIRLVPPSPQQGSPVMVGVHVRNRGGTNAGAFRVIWRAAGPTLGCQWVVASLAAGDERWYQCEFTYGGWNPNYTTTAVVDVDGDVAEADETNNELVLMVNVRPD
ncbi:MAG: hypothetical protein CEE40_07435 [Chloroflexi bacterium B3_Chlor]|nr:MAG: hypothetical protein CEE40_07435 [Chloroflexi bacterium B3_Chlor]